MGVGGEEITTKPKGHDTDAHTETSRACCLSPRQVGAHAIIMVETAADRSELTRSPGGARARARGAAHVPVPQVRNDQGASFSSEKISDFGTVALSFICDKYYPIID